MNPRQRMLVIRLTEKIAKNPEYARAVGIEISNLKSRKSNTEKSFAERSTAESNIMY